MEWVKHGLQVRNESRIEPNHTSEPARCGRIVPNVLDGQIEKCLELGWIGASAVLADQKAKIRDLFLADVHL